MSALLWLHSALSEPALSACVCAPSSSSSMSSSSATSICANGIVGSVCDEASDSGIGRMSAGRAGLIIARTIEHAPSTPVRRRSWRVSTGNCLTGPSSISSSASVTSGTVGVPSSGSSSPRLTMTRSSVGVSAGSALSENCGFIVDGVRVSMPYSTPAS